jgi:hypothetical protein
LLYAEQGLGDTLHFVRFVPMVKQRGGRVILECQSLLLRLLSGFDGIDCLVGTGSPLPAFDVQAPLLSLPGLFHTDLESIPTPVPYLHADHKLVDQRRHSAGASFRVGIAWQGNPTNPGDRHRSIPLVHFEQFAKLSGVRFISLQKGPGAISAPERLECLPGLDESSGAFMDTAAVMMSLDLVISADTVIAHLAGALGVPVWVPLAFAPDWRWLLQRQDSPWYPSMRLFRQVRFGDWEDVFKRIAEELKHTCSD